MKVESHRGRVGLVAVLGFVQVLSPILYAWCSVTPESSAVKMGARGRKGDSWPL